jgi:anti-sigma regulatory factor (Ser/Thr protein kinase)
MSSISVLHFPASTDSPRRARHDVVEALHECGVQEIDDVAALLTSELVTNSVMHASSDVEVSCEIDGRRVRVAVSDNSPATPVVGGYGGTETGGRGVLIVATLADAWGAEVSDGKGKSVWFELSVPAPRSARDRNDER